MAPTTRRNKSSTAATAKVSLSCDECDKKFEFITHLKTHKRFTHKAQKAFPCKICLKTFKKKAYLIIHQRIHDEKTAVSCKLCFRKFPYVSTLIVHLRLHAAGRYKMHSKYLQQQETSIRSLTAPANISATAAPSDDIQPAEEISDTSFEDKRRFQPMDIDLPKGHISHLIKPDICTRKDTRTAKKGRKRSRDPRKPSSSTEKKPGLKLLKHLEAQVFRAPSKNKRNQKMYSYVCNICLKIFRQKTKLRAHHQLIHYRGPSKVRVSHTNYIDNTYCSGRMDINVEASSTKYVEEQTAKTLPRSNLTAKKKEVKIAGTNRRNIQSIQSTNLTSKKRAKITDANHQSVVHSIQITNSTPKEKAKTTNVNLQSMHSIQSTNTAAKKKAKTTNMNLRSMHPIQSTNLAAKKRKIITPANHENVHSIQNTSHEEGESSVVHLKPGDDNEQAAERLPNTNLDPVTGMSSDVKSENLYEQLTDKTGKICDVESENIHSACPMRNVQAESEMCSSSHNFCSEINSITGGSSNRNLIAENGKCDENSETVPCVQNVLHEGHDSSVCPKPSLENKRNISTPTNSDLTAERERRESCVVSSDDAHSFQDASHSKREVKSSNVFHSPCIPNKPPAGAPPNSERICTETWAPNHQGMQSLPLSYHNAAETQTSVVLQKPRGDSNNVIQQSSTMIFSLNDAPLSSAEDHDKHSVHPNVQNYPCHLCGKHFLENEELKRHSQEHCGFFCHLCHLRFSEIDVFRSHVAQHTFKKVIICQFCRRCFSSQRGLDRHLVAHVNNTNYYCEMCDRMYLAVSDLKDHLADHEA